MDIEHVVSYTDEWKALVKQAALASSRRNVLVSDNSKYGMFHIFPLQAFDDIIHDDLLPEKLQEKIKQFAINLHVVKN